MAPLARFTLGSLWSWRPLMAAFEIRRCFRSRAALDALTMAIKEEAPNLILYNYPSFSGAFAALFAHLYHSRMGLPYLILPYSQVEPFRIEDFNMKGVTTCYLLDFVGPKGFAVKLSQVSHGVVIFDHHKSAKALLSPVEDCPENLSVHYDITKSSSLLAYDYFSELLNQNQLCNDQNGKLSLVISDDVWQLKMLLKYIEDADLQQWELSESNAFKIGLSSMRSKLNCITNPYIFDQLLEMSHTEFIAKGRSYIEHRQDAANKLLDGAFKIRLGKGFYGECLGIRADGNSHLCNEIGNQLSEKSSAAGLRPIGAVVYMQRGNLKMSLRSMDSATDTSEISKAYGGGGHPKSSSFIIRMDEYNKWIL